MEWLFLVAVLWLIGGGLWWTILELNPGVGHDERLGAAAMDQPPAGDFKIREGSCTWPIAACIGAGVLGFILFFITWSVPGGASRADNYAWIALLSYLVAVGIALRTWWWPVVSSGMILSFYGVMLGVTLFSGEWNEQTIAGTYGSLLVVWAAIGVAGVAILTTAGTLLGKGLEILWKASVQ